jgi:hypothetical protein
MRELVEFLARSLVDTPDAVTVDEVEAEGRTVCEIRVAPGDVGKIIGRGGRVIGAIRVLASASALKSGRRAHIEVVS